MIQKLIIEADGGSRGNPGNAGSGAVVIDASTGEIMREIAQFIGTATNNVAEYVALIAGLKAADEISESAELLVRMDSKLVIEQMSGGWKIKHPDMQQLGREVQEIARGKKITWQWIPREENSRADALANKAMDELADSNVVPTKTEFKLKASVAEFNALLPSSVRAPGQVTEPLTTVILVRHGRTHLTESKRISGMGGENPQLSEAGIADAKSAADAVASIGVSGAYAHLPKPSVIIASPIARTVETAQIIAKKLGLTVETNDDIQEISFGEWDGLTNHEAASRDPEQWQAWRGSWDVAPPNGESLVDFDERVNRGRRAILAANPGKTVVVVSHVMPIRGFIRAGIDANISAYWRPQISPCSLSIIRFWGDQAAEVITVNNTSHL